MEDVIVVGAGIIGVTIAWELRKAGRDVLLLDQDDPGMGCSWGNAAHFATEQIFPLANGDNLRNLPRYLMAADSPLTVRRSSLLSLIPWGLRYLLACRGSRVQRGARALHALNSRSLASWQLLLQEIGAADLLHTPGTLQLAETVRGHHELVQLQRDLEAFGITSSLLRGHEVSELTGELAPGDYQGLHFPGTAYCDDPHALLVEVFRACIARGVSFRHGAASHVRTAGNDRIEVVVDGKSLFAKSAVIACGVHSKQFAASEGLRMPLVAERGYHMLLPRVSRIPSLPVTLHERQFIMTPMAHGLRLAGTVEFARPGDPPTMRRADMLFDQARQLFPALDAEGGTKWMGCRPTLPDYLPVIDRLGKNREIFASFGHAHLGLTQAALSARLLVNLMQREPVEIDLAPYRADRF